MKNFKDKVAVITGAGGGLGSALALQLAGKGCHLALVDINQQALLSVKQQCEAKGVRVSTHVVNIAVAEEMEQLSKTVISEHGSVNLLINNAGITLQKSFATHSLQDWQRIVGVNLWGVIHGCLYFREALKKAGEEKAGEAHVVNLSSMNAFIGLPTQSSYCATKAAVKAMSESLWAEFAVDGIGMTIVHPGAIQTEMIKATLADSDDIETAKRNYDIAQKIGVSADYAAEKIISAVEKNKMRIRIGKDAVLFDVLKRLLPQLIHKPFKKLARKQLAGA